MEASRGGGTDSPAKACSPGSAARRAAIDIGTNSVKLLVADVASGSVDPVFESSRQTRLGRGLYEQQLLSPESMADTVETVATFARQAEERGAEAVRVIGTSAAREARNRHDLLDAIRRRSGLEVDVLPGGVEADWTFRGVTSDPRLASQPLLIVDVGGGSTEFIVGTDGASRYRESFPLGTVRLLEKWGAGDPPSTADLRRFEEGVHEFLSRRVTAGLTPALTQPDPRPTTLVGTGGTATILAAIERHLARFDRGRLDGVGLTQVQVRHRLEQLWTMPLVERRRVVGLPPERADVILMGAGIYAAVMQAFGFASLRVSLRGLRFAALLDESYAGWRTTFAGGDRKAPSYEEAVRTEARRMLAEFDRTPTHTLHVAELALQLFDALAPLHHYGPRERAWLEAAAVLHDIGWTVALDGRRHHKATARLIRRQQWQSLDAPARELVAQIARYHRKSIPVMRHQPFAELDEADRRRVLQLGALLRLADGLDRPHRQRVKRVTVEIGRDELALRLFGTGPLTRETIGAEKKSDLAKLAFHRRVRVESKTPEAGAAPAGE